MSVGGLIALLVLVICVVLAVVGSPIPLIALGLIGGLAVAMLLGAVPITWRAP